MLALVPAEAAEDAQVPSQFLFGVQTEAILHRAERLMQRDVGVESVPARYAFTASRYSPICAWFT
jgi:hypothetical protein